MSQRSPARAETRVPVRVLPSARTAIRTTLDILADIALLLANDEAFEVPGDIAATLQAKGHVAIVDGAGTDGSAEASPSTPVPVDLPAAAPPVEVDPVLVEWSRGARERLRAYVERDAQTGCLVWKKTKLQHTGYGGLCYQGSRYLAHRLSWLAHRGPIPAGFFVCHSCDNRACIEISHLFLGTPQDNTTDMIRKGRARMFAAARLTEAEVAVIKRHLADGQSVAGIARLTSATYHSVHAIKSNRSWRHVKAAARVEDVKR